MIGMFILFLFGAFFSGFVTMAIAEQKGFDKWLGFAIGPIACAGLIFLLSSLGFFGDDLTPTNNPHIPDAIELHVQAQQFVKQGLKAPSTAKFPLEPVSAGTDGSGLYQVESYVDSQNSFGASIRSEWMVNMRLVGDRWVLEKMRVGGNIIYDIESDNTR